MIVEIFDGLVGFETSRQNVVKDLSGGGFADGAGDCDDLELAFFAIPGGEGAERFDNIFNLQNGLAGKFIGWEVFTDNCAGGAFCEGIGEKVVAIEIFARYGEEAIAGLNGSRIRGNTCDS